MRRRSSGAGWSLRPADQAVGNEVIWPFGSQTRARRKQRLFAKRRSHRPCLKMTAMPVRAGFRGASGSKWRVRRNGRVA